MPYLLVVAPFTILSAHVIVSYSPVSLQTMFVDINKNMDWEMTFEEFLDEMSRKDAKLRT